MRRRRRARRAVGLAFAWHCMEFGAVAAIFDTKPSVALLVLFILAAIGWLWSLYHLAEYR